MPKPKYTKQKDGRYRASVSTGTYTDDGAPIKKYLSARTIKELEEKIEALHRDLNDGISLFDGSTPFGAYADKWLNTYKSSKGIRTQEMYSRIIRGYLQELSNAPIDKITRTNIQELINANSEHPRTCEQIILTLRQIFKSAVNDGIIRRSPCVDIELPRHILEEKRPLTKEEKAAVRAAGFTERERAFVSILLGTGMRPAEAYALRWSDIDFQSKEITICKAITFDAGKPVVVYPKTNDSIRTVQAPDFVFNALLEYKAINHQLNLFGLANGKYKTKGGYRKEWDNIHRKIEQALGKPTDLSPYCFRHNFCTELYYSGISIKEAQRLLGHSDYKMIMEVYAHCDSERENVRDKLNAINF